MNLIKIGKYISEKRKNLGLTQKQLAEQLGMSDKSVSKWERGICLPDVSIYFELCQILEISINEFLSGEDIPEENLVRKSEENIIEITTENKKEQKRLNSVIHRTFFVLSVTLCLMIIAGIYAAYHWFTTVNENDVESIAYQAADYLGKNKLSVIKAETRGNYLAALCKDKKDVLSMCIFERDSLFENRWKAYGGRLALNEGSIESWNFGNSSGDAVIVFGGWKIPDEVKWYEFTNHQIDYICPVNEEGVVLDIFIIPDVYDINGYAIPLDSNQQEIK